MRVHSVMMLAMAAGLANGPAGAVDVPEAVAAPGETIVLQVHAEGAQIYECKPDPSGKTLWQFREPIATLLQDGKTVGRHFAGPSWEAIDGSKVTGKVAARAPGATPKDIPWLKLNVADEHGDGILKNVTTIQRLATQGGGFEGECATAGAFHAEPYAADYVFLRK